MPIKSSKPRGRPAYKPTPAARRTVSVAAGGGMRHEDIAIALGIGVDTLRKYFEPELSVGANLRRMEVLQGLYQAAKRGSTAAAKAYLAVEPQLAVPPAPPAEAGAPAAAVPAKKVGKKEQQQADAVTAGQGTDWDELLRRTPVPPAVQ